MKGTRNRRRFPIFIGLLLILSFCFASAAKAEETTGISMAPVNPAFLDAISNAAFQVQQQGVEAYSLGLIPSPHDLSHLKGQALSIIPLVVGFPASYDLRILGKLTPVRDQGACGSCWSFATYGSLESMLMPAEEWDFSENSLKNTHGFDLGHCDGGNAYTLERSCQ
jgi:C1A family cysteine protease